MIGKPKMQSYWPSLGTKDSMVVLLHNVCVCIRLQFPVVQWCIQVWSNHKYL